MIYFLKHFKGIAYFLAILILFQSCIVYKGSTVAEVSEYEEKSIKIKTTEGKEYKLKWIEERDGNIVSIKNVKKVYINKTDILQVELLNPLPQIVPLSQELNLDGEIRIKSKDGEDYYKYRSYIKTRELEGIITGYKMVKSDTTTITIPISQIEKIKVVNRGASTASFVLGALGIGFLIIWIHTMSQLETT